MKGEGQQGRGSGEKPWRSNPAPQRANVGSDDDSDFDSFDDLDDGEGGDSKHGEGLAQDHFDEETEEQAELKSGIRRRFR